MTLTLRINGADVAIASSPDTPLLFVLREELNLKGSKFGCGLEQCGACMVLVDGAAVPSCVSPADTFAGKDITTIEGIADRPTGKRVQDAFVTHTAAQCGYCTAGLVVAVTALLERDPKANAETVKTALAPNLCRCGSHPRVLCAIEAAQA
jgi:aerobic-type carbon monoxide dehydrogenase small subunit (CoxS/CutS family)